MSHSTSNEEHDTLLSNKMLNPNNENIIIVNDDMYTGASIYMISHVIISFFAIYLSWKCNGGKFNPGAFIIALLFPYLYILYALAVNGGCM